MSLRERASGPLPVVAPPSTVRPWVGPEGQVMRRLELHLTYHCPERCLFCSEEHRMVGFSRFPVTWGRVATVLRTHAERGVGAVHLTGGEPTISPHFLKACMLAKKLGMRTSIGTIGTMLSRADFAEKALPWLDEALFSVHGPCAEVHDRMAGRQGSFQQIIAAMTLARRLRPDFGLFMNTVVTRHNVAHLGATVRLARRLGVQLLVVSNTTPEGAASDRYEELAVPLDVLRDAVSGLGDDAGEMTLRFFGMPMCILGDLAARSNDVHWDPRVTVEWMRSEQGVVYGEAYSWTPNRRRCHTPICAQCTRSALCQGVYDRFAELFDTSLLQPFPDSSR